ncbi:MAG: hypothetical protein ACTSRZ_06510 [Promethearchaeota archaeon]
MNSEATYTHLRKKIFSKFNRFLPVFLRYSILYIAIYVTITYFATNIMVQIHGADIGYVGFYWMIQILGIAITSLFVWKWNHPLMTIIGPIYLICFGYSLTRLLITEFWYLMPPIFILHAIFYIILLGNLFYFIIHGVKEKSVSKWFAMRKQEKSKGIDNKKKKSLTKKAKAIKKIILLLGILIFSSFLVWSYFGFSRAIKIEDLGDNNDIRISFWSYPFGAFNISYYDTPEGQKEISYYKTWNSSFYLSINNITLKNASLLENYTKIFHKLEENELQIIINICPVNSFVNSSNPKGDFTTYYYTKEINETIDLTVNWIKSENFTNIRGISLDVEGPIYHFDNQGNPQIANIEKWMEGVQSFQNKFNEFKQQCPGNQTFLIAIDGIIFDFYDDDPDLDIMQTTASVPPQWDYYGYMTYDVNSPRGSYWFYYKLLNGLERHGDKFVPWIGWFDNPEILKDEYAYESTIEQFKLVKSLGIKEVVFAPLRNLLGNYSDFEHRNEILQTMFQRLDDLNSTRNSTFDSFNLRIYQDSRLYKNLPLYIKKWTPFTFMSNSAVWKDLMLEIYGGWLMWVELIGGVSYYSAIILLIRKKKKEK